MKKHQRTVTSARISFIWGVGIVALTGLFAVAEPVIAIWSDSSSTPLTGPAKTFLNGSTVAQRKDGSLLIGSLTRSSRLCLNADPAVSIYAASSTTCIDSWDDIGALSGPYVRRQQFVVPGNQSNPLTYGTPDAGFAAVIGLNTRNQYISTVVKANTNPANPTPVKYAVYATDSGVNSRSAAQLSGKTVIDHSDYDVQLCLNGQCITHWSDVSLFAQTAVIRLQPTTQPNAYLETDAGHGSVSGVLWLQRGLTIGRPATTAPVSWTNQDGQCTAENGETSANGLLDCI